MNNFSRPLGIATIALVLLALSFAAPPPAAAQLNITGQWSTVPYMVPVNPIGVALLNNGKVLIVGGSENNSNNTVYKLAVWDPTAGTFSQQTTPWDLFGNGMSLLPDGRVIIVGGTIQYDPFYGPPLTTIFDPATEKAYPVEDMTAGRWYPTTQTLSDGGTMVLGGLDGQGNPNTTVEIYDAGGGWTPPYASNFTPGLSPRLHLLASGNVFMSGPDSPSRTFDPSQGAFGSEVQPTVYGNSRLYGSSVLLPLTPDSGYRPGVMIFGGNTQLATDTVEFIDLGVWPEQWVSVPSMSVPRVTMNAVLLPDGKILALGGSTVFNDPSTAHRGAETYDPVTQTWTPSGTAAYDRLHHSSALLLPDATVWVAGSSPSSGTFEPNMEIYAPPYLFTPTGALAPRPTITSAPRIVGYGESFTVTTPNAAEISKVVLMRPGSNAHAFDSETRLIYTYFTPNTDSLTVVGPTKQGAAPPGWYMLFIIDNAGVPSVATFVQLMPNPSNQPPTATITTPAMSSVTISAGQSVTFAATASDPDGAIAQYAWVFPGGSPAKSPLQNPGAVTFATPGVYTVSLTVLDNLGMNNPSPPTVTVTVGPEAALGASITSPVSGATVSGTITVAMAASNAQGSSTQFVLTLDNATTLSTQTIPSDMSATYGWNTAGVTAGAHTLNLTVTDGAGRTATAAINVVVTSTTASTPPPPPPATTTTSTPTVDPVAQATYAKLVQIAGNAYPPHLQDVYNAYPTLWGGRSFNEIMTAGTGAPTPQAPAPMAPAPQASAPMAASTPVNPAAQSAYNKLVEVAGNAYAPHLQDVYNAYPNLWAGLNFNEIMTAGTGAPMPQAPAPQASAPMAASTPANPAAQSAYNKLVEVAGNAYAPHLQDVYNAYPNLWAGLSFNEIMTAGTGAPTPQASAPMAASTPANPAAQSAYNKLVEVAGNAYPPHLQDVYNAYPNLWAGLSFNEIMTGKP